MYNTLQWRDRGVWKFGVQGVAVVYPRQDKSTHQPISAVFVENLANLAKSPEMEEASRRDLGDVLAHGQRTVENDTKVTDSVGRLNDRVADPNREISCSNTLQVELRPKPYQLGLGRV